MVDGQRLKEVAGEASVSHVLENMNPTWGLLLILDEAQHIGDLEDFPDKKIQATSTLKRIHNGEFPYPVILLAAGLGQTKESFRMHGVSRFKGAVM
ncbi:MAG: hypothetical protein OXF08_11765 [Bacteroidetes bacterium]|nr:hypothetical protein [Bacteroidota bacterium]